MRPARVRKYRMHRAITPNDMFLSMKCDYTITIRVLDVIKLAYPPKIRRNARALTPPNRHFSFSNPLNLPPRSWQTGRTIGGQLYPLLRPLHVHHPNSHPVPNAHVLPGMRPLDLPEYGMVHEV